MRRAVPFALLALLCVFSMPSCANNEEDLSHDLKIVNNSSLAVERIALTYTGIESRAVLPDLEIDVMVPAGQTKTVEVALDPSSDYYFLFIINDTTPRRIFWSGGYADREYVLLSKGGASTCTIGGSDVTTFAGENNVIPAVYDWGL